MSSAAKATVKAVAAKPQEKKAISNYIYIYIHYIHIYIAALLSHKPSAGTYTMFYYFIYYTFISQEGRAIVKQHNKQTHTTHM